MLARRYVCRTDGAFGFAIARTIRLVIYFRVWEGVDTTDSVAVRPTTVTCSHVLMQPKPGVAINRQVKYQILSRDSSRLKCPNHPVLCTSSLPFRTPVVCSHGIIFPVSRATTDVLSQEPSRMPPKYVRSGRRGIVSLGHYFFILFQQLNVISFLLSFGWKLSMAGITAISCKNRKTVSSRQSWFLAGQLSCLGTS